MEGVDLHEGLMEVGHEGVVLWKVVGQALLLKLPGEEDGLVEEAVVEVALQRVHVDLLAVLGPQVATCRRLI